MKNNQNKTCPVCGSTDIGLWNNRKQTFHCHECDSYFSKYGSVITDFRTHNGSKTSRWNGFTDPDDFPTDGFGGSGW